MLKVLLMALTGFGNVAIKALKENTVEILGLFTREEKRPFPYYPEEDIIKLAQREKIKVYKDPPLDKDSTGGLVRALNPDLILVASYHRYIPPSIFSIAAGGSINLHPSLLPAYRGPTPTYWVIINKEKITGVTAHYLTDEIDSGPIIFQEKVRIEKNETNGTLRHKLANLTGRVISKIIIKNRRNLILPSRPQDKTKASYYPKIGLKDTYINLNNSPGSIDRQLRGLSPYPGANIIIKGKTFKIKSF